MKTVFDNRMVAHLFAHQSQEHGRNSSGSFSFHGQELISYNTTIAYNFGHVVLISADNMTPTTGKQLSYVRAACRHLDTLHVHGLFQYGDRLYSPNLEVIQRRLNGAFMVRVERLLDTPKRASRKRVDLLHELRTIQRALGTLELQYTQANLEVLPVINAAYDNETTGLDELTAKREEARRLALKKQRKEDQEKVQQWLAGLPVQFPRSYQQGGFALLRVHGDVVQTSLGVEVPLSHVVRALKFYHSKVDSNALPWFKNGETCRVGHFQLDHISTDGVVKAGCHTITPEEIKRFEWMLVVVETDAFLAG